MINKNELRIGNYVLHTGKYLLVESVDDGGINASSGYGGGIEHDAYLDDIMPILLTPEILEKCKIKGKHFCDEFFIETNLSGVLIGHRPHGVKYLRHIKYLHQLQNLYFALTGKELPITL